MLSMLGMEDRKPKSKVQNPNSVEDRNDIHKITFYLINMNFFNII